MTTRSRSRALSILAVSTALVAGCGGASLQHGGAKGGKAARAATASPFPSRAALDKLAQTPVAATPGHDVATATEWKVDVAPVDAPLPVETRFAQVATKAGMNLTYAKDLRCVAREVGRFWLEHNAYPDERLKRFMIAACGMTNQLVMIADEHAEAPAELPDDQLLAQWQAKAKIPVELKGSISGVWMGRKGKRITITTAAAQAQAPVVVSPADASGHLTVRGTAPAGTEQVLALVNQGDHAVARCEQDLATPLPLFAFTCAMAEGDKTAWVEVSTRAQGRLLLRSYGLALARRDASAPLQYSAPPRRDGKAATTAADVTAAVLEGVNRTRAAGKLAPLALAPNQAATNERLAPHFFQAANASDQEKGDMVGLGLLAGWDVQGTIRNGNLYAAMLTGGGDANAWLDYALEMPIGRYTMLEANARQIAIGVAPPSTFGGIGAVVTTYQFFGGADHRADVAKVVDRIARTRVARGLPQPAVLQGMVGLGQQATLVNAGQKDAAEALEAGLLAERDRLHKSVRGWAIATNDLDSVPYPPELLAAGPVTIGVEITHTKEPGAAWGQYIVFLVMETNDAAPSPQIQAGTTARVASY